MEKLKELFSKAQIKYVVSVDDCHRNNDRPDDFLIKSNMAENQESVCAFFLEIGEEEYADTVRDLPQGEVFDFIDAVFSNIDKNALELYADSYMKDQQKESTAKATLLALLEELKLSEIIENYITLTNSNEAQAYFDHIQENLSICPDKRVLWMIDKDLSQSGGSSDSGVELIKNFISLHKPHNIYALTSAQLAGTNNDTFRVSISENISANDTLLACVVDKHNIMERKYSQLYDQISHGFRQNYSATIIKELYSIFSDASKGANETIQRFGDDTLHKVLFESGRAEGVSPIEVFQRLLLIIIREDILKQISSKYDDIARLIYDYSQMCDWCGILEKDYPDYEVIKKARISECYDSFVNTRYLPIASGDIFEIGDAYFILIGQSCNLTIRENGERKAQCATLARISKDNENDQKAISKYPLHYFRENEIWSIDFNDCINVDFSVLDLCTLNATGKAELDDAYNLADVRYRYTNAIYKKLKNTVDYSRELIRQYRGLADGFSRKEISFEDVCAGIRKIYKDNSAEVSPSFRGGLMFNIARYARISSDILDDILKQYAEYHSRKGLQHDFAKEYKSMTYDVGYEVDWLSYGVDESEAKNALIPQYVFYQSGSYKNDELKKAVLNDFREYYTNAVFDGLGCKPSDQCKCDIKKKALTVPSKDIPVQIGDESFIDVLRCAKDGKCTYRIPVNKISVWKNKQNQTAKMDNGAQVSISNNVATFTFPNGVSHEFFLDNVVEQPISFKLVILQKICLQITYSNQPEIVLENSTATVMA